MSLTPDQIDTIYFSVIKADCKESLDAADIQDTVTHIAMFEKLIYLETNGLLDYQKPLAFQGIIVSPKFEGFEAYVANLAGSKERLEYFHNKLQIFLELKSAKLMLEKSAHEALRFAEEFEKFKKLLNLERRENLIS